MDTIESSCEKTFIAPIKGKYSFFWADKNGNTIYLIGHFMNAGDIFAFPEGFQAPFGGSLQE